MILFLLLLLCPAAARAQNPPAPPPAVAQIQRLYDAGRYAEIVALIPASPGNSAELDLYRGLALAQLQRWQEAEAAFEAGHEKDPANPRFLAELAGAEYKQKDFRGAKQNLREALRLNPEDEYARNFLATIYFLDGNLDAALENWNRIGKPRISAIDMLPEPRVKNDLLERAFAVSRLSELRLDDLRTTEARLDNLEIFPRYRFELVPAAEENSQGSFTLEFHSVERHGWGSSTADALFSLFRGLPYLTIFPAYHNLGDSARNITSLFRWDDNKRRVFAAFSEPLGENPKWRFAFHVDARNENWNLTDTFRGASPPLSDLNLEKIELGPELRSVESGRWSWQTELSYAYRRFRNVSGVNPAAAEFFVNGGSLDYRARAEYQFLYLPEHRFTLDSSASGDFGKNFARALGAFGSTDGLLRLRWLPQARGDDYETTSELRAGGIFGHATLDQLYQLGIERDSDLWLRGIAGTRDGRKGNAPLGRQFALWNSEVDKNVYTNGLLAIRLAPFFDAGRIADPSGDFGSSGWRWDPGIALKLRVLGSVGVAVSYARDFPSGSHTLYLSSSR